MRISDWSSDVCSSDLEHVVADEDGRRAEAAAGDQLVGIGLELRLDRRIVHRLGKRSRIEAGPTGGFGHHLVTADVAVLAPVEFEEIGRASCRERVCQYV